MPRTGDIIAIDDQRFVIEDGIGEPDEGAKGGFSVVHAARQLDTEGRPTGQPLAIKLIDRSKVREYSRNSGKALEVARARFIASFRIEIETLWALKRHHQTLSAVGIVEIVHSGLMTFPKDPHPYPALLMERCGDSLHSIASAQQETPLYGLRRRLMTREGILDLLDDMAHALLALAAIAPDGKQMVHRDVKPQNILAKEDGRFRLTDFGSAKEFQDCTHSIGGITLSYIAPEVWPAILGYRNGTAERPLVVPKTADIYALGMTLIHVLTNNIPWRQKSREWPVDGEVLDIRYRAKLRAAIRALPPRVDAAEAVTVMPGLPTPKAHLGYCDGLEELIADMVRVSLDERPDTAALHDRVTALRAVVQAAAMIVPPIALQPQAAHANAPTPPPPPPLASPQSIPLRQPAALPRRRAIQLALGGLAVAVALLVTAAPTRPGLALAAPALARWSGAPDAAARPLCEAAAGHGGVVAGERVVATVTITWGLFPSGQDIAGEVRPSTGPARSMACVPLDRDRNRNRWQCVADTTGLPPGEVVLRLSVPGTQSHVTTSAEIIAKQTACPTPVLPTKILSPVGAQAALRHLANLV